MSLLFDLLILSVLLLIRRIAQEKGRGLVQPQLVVEEELLVLTLHLAANCLLQVTEKTLAASLSMWEAMELYMIHKA